MFTDFFKKAEMLKGNVADTLVPAWKRKRFSSTQNNLVQVRIVN